MHPCAVENCPEQIDAAFLMCSFHWHKVSIATKKDLNRTWRNINSDRYIRADAAPVREYRAARAKAVLEATAEEAVV